MNDLSVVKKSPQPGPGHTLLQGSPQKRVESRLIYSLLDWSHPDYPGFSETRTAMIRIACGG